MSATRSEHFTVLSPPARRDCEQASVILYGTIDASGPLDWRSHLIDSLSDLPVAIINPVRDDWDDSWEEDISCPKFKQQVEWEMDHGQLADVVAIHFGADTMAPITLLELGMYAASGKVVVSCSPEFAKRGNVQIVCQRYNIPLLTTMTDFEAHIRSKLTTAIEDRRGASR